MANLTLRVGGLYKLRESTFIGRVTHHDKECADEWPFRGHLEDSGGHVIDEATWNADGSFMDSLTDHSYDCVDNIVAECDKMPYRSFCGPLGDDPSSMESVSTKIDQCYESNR